MRKLLNGRILDRVTAQESIDHLDCGIVPRTIDEKGPSVCGKVSYANDSHDSALRNELFCDRCILFLIIVFVCTGR